jgi:hypothetical protein
MINRSWHFLLNVDSIPSTHDPANQQSLCQTKQLKKSANNRMRFLRSPTKRYFSKSLKWYQRQKIRHQRATLAACKESTT